MKKIISLLLCMVMIFSFAVPSFAYTPGNNSTELDALNNIDYYTYWIWSDFSEKLDDIKNHNYNSLSQLLDINEFTRANNTVLNNLYSAFFGDGEWTDSPLAEHFLYYSEEYVSYLTSIQSSTNNLKTVLYILMGVGGYDDWDLYTDSWFVKIYDDIHQLREVLADDEDLAFKESQKDNQQYIQDTFFNPGSALSLDVSKLTDFTNQFTDFTDSFNFIEEVGTSTSPLESISEGSDFSQWFTTETGQDMDPTFGGGSGGGGGGEEPDPDPDPDPDPEPTIKNWLPLATTEPGGTEIYNGIGYKTDTRWSSSGGAPAASSNYCLSGWIPVSSSDIVYLYRFTMSINGDSGSCYAVKYNDGSISVTNIYDSSFPDENGVYSYVVPENVSYVRFSVGLFTSDSVITINQYPIQTAAIFSLRAQSVPYVNEPEVVTSYYADRMNEYFNLLGGDE